MRRRFPDADAVVFGHSHIPLLEEARGFAIFNPGSPTDRRRQPVHTMGLATVTGGQVAFELVGLG
jgi:predicted phosphodiesterase